MNRSIRLAAIFSLLLTLVLLVNLTIVHAFKDDEYARNSLNSRNYFELKSIPRGQIFAGGKVLAKSEKLDDGFYHRSYPTTPEAYGPLVGYISDQYGEAGLEAGYNGILNGTDDALFALKWKDMLLGREHRGANIDTTIIPAVQETAYNELTRHGYNGAVVAIRPSTGEILALASSPGFDPNPIVNNDTAKEAWAQLTENPNKPLLNTATQETLPAGSIFKIITTTAGIAKGYTPQSTVTAQNQITLPGTNTTLENYDGQHCGTGGDTTTLATAFALSCNTAFVELGIDAGADEFRKAAEAYGIGEKYDLGIPTAAGGLGDLPDDAALGQSSIGQRDVNISVLHAAVMAATVANEGRRMEPHLVSKITGADLKELKRFDAKQLKHGVDPEVARTLKELMRDSERHTAGYAGQDIASKTGTAEHGDPDTPPHTWYVAFGPSEHADVAVAVVVKDGGGQGVGATGGSVSAPIGRAVIDAALKAMR